MRRPRKTDAVKGQKTIALGYCIMGLIMTRLENVQDWSQIHLSYDFVLLRLVVHRNPQVYLVLSIYFGKLTSILVNIDIEAIINQTNQYFNAIFRCNRILCIVCSRLHSHSQDFAHHQFSQNWFVLLTIFIIGYFPHLRFMLFLLLISLAKFCERRKKRMH